MESIFDFMDELPGMILKGFMWVFFGSIILVIKIQEEIERSKARKARKAEKERINRLRGVINSKGYVSKNKYILYCFFLGWMGAHKFYEERYFLGILYLISLGTGIPFVISIFEGMRALRKEPDTYGNIQV